MAVALFDFDGTLTRRSTIVPFFLRAAGWKKLVACAPFLAAHGVLYLLKRHTFVEMMHLCASRALVGLTKDELAQAGVDLAAQLAREGFWPAARDRFIELCARGDEVAIVTGGFGFVAEAWLRQTGLARCRVFSSQPSYGSEGGLSGVQSVCVGPQKLAAVEWARQLGGSVQAYGNSNGDREMLAAADEPFWVDRRGCLSALTTGTAV